MPRKSAAFPIVIFEEPMLRDNITNTIPMLSIWPLKRIVPTVADATPYTSLGTELIIALVFGEENNPNPTPSRTRFNDM